MSAQRQTTALFVTCLVDQLFPEVGEATVRLLEGRGRRVEFPAAQTCCGQPAFNIGHAGEARRLAKRMIEIFEPYDGVVAPSGSCVSMVRIHFPELLRQVKDLELVELPDADVCCGFGGAFSAKMPELSGAMLDAKLKAVEASGATVLTATDCGCLMHLAGALKRRRSVPPEGGKRNLVEVRHIAEILAGQE